MSIALGTLIAFPLGVALVIGFAALTIFAFRRWQVARNIEPERYEITNKVEWLVGWIGSLVITVGILLGTAGGMYPYNMDYHSWHDKSGQIETISSRLLGGSEGGTTQRFVVRFTSGEEYACDDTRCSLLKPGDTLTLSCKKQWQYSGTDGWNCNFKERVAK